MSAYPWCPTSKDYVPPANCVSPLHIAGDDVPNENDVPGSRSCSHINASYQHEHFVAANQQICKGDIVTIKDELLVRVNSTSDRGNGKDWGDVGNGTFMALQTVDTRDELKKIYVYSPGACVETILDEGIRENSPLFVDLRDCDTNKRRTRRSHAVNDMTPKSADRTLWQRSRGIPPEGIDGDIKTRAFLGTLQCIRTKYSNDHRLSVSGDLGIVWLGQQGTTYTGISGF